MREIQFDLTQDSYFPQSAFGGFEGEHNATSLSLCLPDRLLASDAIYYMVFETEKNDEVIFSAPLLPEENVICAMLPKHVMLSPRVTVHAAAYRKEGEELVEIAKSSRVILEIKYPESDLQTQLSRDGGEIPGLVIESAVLPESENPVSSRALYNEIENLEQNFVQSAFVNEVGDLILKKKNEIELCAGNVIGPQGPIGERGEQGIKGDKGDKGDSFTYYKFDFNGDGVVNEEDSELLINYVNFPKLYKLSWWSDPDVNGDGKVDLDDAFKLMYLLKDDDPLLNDAIPKTKIIDGAFSATSEKPIQNKVVSNGTANALKGKKEGAVVAMTDVSPLEHNISVKLESDTITDFSTVKLTKCGKNLLPYPYTSAGFTNGVKQVGDVLFTDLGDGKIKIDGTLTSGTPGIWLNRDMAFLNGQTYAITDLRGSGCNFYCVHYDETGTEKYEQGSFEWKEGYVFRGFLLQVNTKQEYKDFIVSPQLEVGPTATEYEPYKEPISCSKPKSEGTVEGVTSLYPATTLMTDTEGVTITAEYNRDLNKAFAELTQAIITIGGTL